MEIIRTLAEVVKSFYQRTQIFRNVNENSQCFFERVQAVSDVLTKFETGDFIIPSGQQKQTFEMLLKRLETCLSDSAEFFKQFSDSSKFKRWLKSKKNQLEFNILDRRLSACQTDLQTYTGLELKEGQKYLADRIASLKGKVTERKSLIKKELHISSSALTFNIDAKTEAEGLLGVGTFGSVYRCELYGSLAAIKLLNILHMDSQSLVDFEKEAAVMESLRHPNIVQLYGIVTKPRYALVMEYMPKTSLYCVLGNLRSQGEKLSWDLRCQIALDVASGLSYLHHKEIVHRDLKSLNVLLNDQMRAKLTDFGLAKIKTTSSVTSSKKVSGTIQWMSPGLLKGEEKQSSCSDMYSYGVVLWELLTVQVPFEDVTNQMALMTRIIHGKPLSLSKEQEDEQPIYAELLKNCFDAEPLKRPTAEQALIDLKRIPQQKVVEKKDDSTFLENQDENEGDFDISPSSSHLPSVHDCSEDFKITENWVDEFFVDEIQDEKQIIAKEAKAKKRPKKRQYIYDRTLLKQMAKQGDVDAQARLGRAYFVGEGIKKDLKEAEKWFGLARQNINDPAGQWALGYCCLEGIGIKKNISQAISLFRKAADDNYAPAQNSLGACYQDGPGVRKDERKAVRLYTLAAKQEYVVAQCNLGVCYANGIGVRKDEREAARLFSLAADQGEAQAQYNLGVCYKYGAGVRKDEREAVRLYSLAAEQGHADAQCYLGVCYENGTVVRKDEREAVRLYTLAANQRFAAAQYNLGVCYDNGTGVAKNEQKAIEFYTLAANQGHATAQQQLADLKKSNPSAFFRKSESKKEKKFTKLDTKSKFSQRR